MTNKPTEVEDVIVTIDGVTHRGTYYVQNSMVYVQSLTQTKATPVGGYPPEILAEILLSELVRC